AIFLFTCKSFSQVLTNINWVENVGVNDNDKIYYDINKKLVWANFEGVPNLPNPIAAITSSGFGYKSDMHTTNGKGQINVYVYCYFSKSNSWVKAGRNTPYVLNHEQHHFDATFLIAKLFINKIKKATLTSSNMNKVLGDLYKECNMALKKLQNEYDAETKNGQIILKQEKWNKYFEAKLNEITN
ncbi:MAG: hypothetical protein ABL929_11060, partial [Ferruginibacter sp.]